MVIPIKNNKNLIKISRFYAAVLVTVEEKFFCVNDHAKWVIAFSCTNYENMSCWKAQFLANFVKVLRLCFAAFTNYENTIRRLSGRGFTSKIAPILAMFSLIVCTHS